MPATMRSRLVPLAAALLTVVGSVAAADPGWVTIRNDTQRVIVVQNSVTVDGRTKRCKPVRLLPGESLREFHAAPTLTLEVFDGKNPMKSLFAGDLSLVPDKQTFAVGGDGPLVKVTVLPPR